jgi:manganese/zinc/iron transport system substrate-binding protein
MMRVGTIVLGVSGLLLLSGCSGETDAASGTAVLAVTATTGMIADAAREVGGARVAVAGLMGPGVDPHLYKPTQGDLEKLTDADVILYNGLHLEGKMVDVLEKMAERTLTVAVTESIPREKLRQPPEFAGQYDPHVWFDVALWMHAVERIRDALAEADPEHKAEYEKNAEAYLAELKELDTFVRQRIAEIPPDQRVLVTAHDAFGYFGQAYGLEVMGLQGISTAAEYGLKDLERLVDIIAGRKIKAIFVESSVSPRSIEALQTGVEARGHNVEIGGTLYSDAMGPEGTPEGTYLGMVRHNVSTIVEALN